MLVLPLKPLKRVVCQGIRLFLVIFLPYCMFLGRAHANLVCNVCRISGSHIPMEVGRHSILCDNKISYFKNTAVFDVISMWIAFLVFFPPSLPSFPLMLSMRKLRGQSDGFRDQLPNSSFPISRTRNVREQYSSTECKRG